MKLTVALALLACTQGVKVNDDAPEKTMHVQDSANINDLAAAKIESQADEEVDADIDEEADADFDAADIDDDKLIAELNAGDLHELMDDPMDIFEAL